jgi:hypothetical protein
MKLFRRGSSAKTVAATPPPKLQQVSLSAEHKAILEKPVDSRVERILQGIYADRAAAERALNDRRVIAFPYADSGERRVIQDKDGFWRILPGEPERKDVSLLDGL